MARSPCGCFVVANYWPPGNWMMPGEFDANVQRPDPSKYAAFKKQEHEVAEAAKMKCHQCRQAIPVGQAYMPTLQVRARVNCHSFFVSPVAPALRFRLDLPARKVTYAFSNTGAALHGLQSHGGAGTLDAAALRRQTDFALCKSAHRKVLRNHCAIEKRPRSVPRGH